MRTVRKLILIACEGAQTEPNYLAQLKNRDYVKKSVTLKVKQGKGGSRLQIVTRALNLKKAPKRNGQPPYDEVWCVMDTERLNNETSRNDLAEALRLARENDILVCLSNPSFEVWLLAHFVRWSRAFNDSNAVETALSNYWQQSFNKSYDKSDKDHFKYLESRLEDAINNAKVVREEDHGLSISLQEANSATEVYKLIEKLIPR